MSFLTSAAVGALLLVPAIAVAQTMPSAPAGTQTAPATPAGAQTQPTAPATGAQPQAGAPTAAATPTVGATVYDSAGAAVGTIDQVTPQAVVVNVDSAKVSLPPTSIGSGPQGLRIAITRAEVVAAAQQAQAGAQQQVQSRLTPGTTVRGTGGAVVGTVKSADAQNVTLTTPRGDVQLPVSGFGMGPSGPVIGMTSAQLDAAMTQAGAGQAAAGSAATSGTEADAATGTTAGTGTASADTPAASGTTSTETKSTTAKQTKRTPR